MLFPEASSCGSMTRFSTFDPQALVPVLQEGAIEHVQLQKGRFQGHIAHTQSDLCRTDWGQYNLSLLARGDLSPTWITVGIFLSGEGPWYVQGRQVRNGDFVLFAEGGELSISLPAQPQWMSVQLPRQYLERLGFKLPPQATTVHLPGHLPPDEEQALQSLATVLGPQRAQDPSAALGEQAHAQLREWIVTELAARWNPKGAADPVKSQSRQQLVRAAHQWCQDNGDAPLRMDMLCQELKVSIWQLERAFQQSFGLPPQRLLTLHRLARARRDLLTPTQGVTEVAMAHGFVHLGRFASLYKDYFGETPSATARAARH